MIMEFQEAIEKAEEFMRGMDTNDKPTVAYLIAAVKELETEINSLRSAYHAHLDNHFYGRIGNA